MFISKQTAATHYFYLILFFPWIATIYSAPADPVEISYFSAVNSNGEVHLSWKTALEINNSGFEVERLPDPEKNIAGVDNWTKIGFMKGSGDSSDAWEYSFIDYDPGEGNISYRLKQIDNDSSYKYSTVVNVTVYSMPAELMQNTPNPFHTNTIIKYYIPEKEHVIIGIYDLLGKEIIKLVDEVKEAGEYEVKWNGKDSFGLDAKGNVLMYRMKAGNFYDSKKMNLE